mmetsp:Transcript_99571/g.171435  ORF Transcript_99571/g.171435 Transcript_99571/m.171435 type:complete len:230 (-) Transcript_99571:359-1048(-)
MVDPAGIGGGMHQHKDVLALHLLQPQGAPGGRTDGVGMRRRNRCPTIPARAPLIHSVDRRLVAAHSTISLADPRLRDVHVRNLSGRSPGAAVVGPGLVGPDLKGVHFMSKVVHVPVAGVAGLKEGREGAHQPIVQQVLDGRRVVGGGVDRGVEHDGVVWEVGHRPVPWGSGGGGGKGPPQGLLCVAGRAPVAGGRIPILGVGGPDVDGPLPGGPPHHKRERTLLTLMAG